MTECLLYIYPLNGYETISISKWFDEDINIYNFMKLVGLRVIKISIRKK